MDPLTDMAPKATDEMLYGALLEAISFPLTSDLRTNGLPSYVSYTELQDTCSEVVERITSDRGFDPLVVEEIHLALDVLVSGYKDLNLVGYDSIQFSRGGLNLIDITFREKGQMVNKSLSIDLFKFRKRLYKRLYSDTITYHQKGRWIPLWVGGTIIATLSIYLHYKIMCDFRFIYSNVRVFSHVCPDWLR